MSRMKGKLSVLNFPNFWGNCDDYETRSSDMSSDNAFSQELIDSWGATRRAFLSSCIRDREWIEEDEDEDCEITFHGG